MSIKLEFFARSDSKKPRMLFVNTCEISDWTGFFKKRNISSSLITSHSVARLSLCKKSLILINI